VPGRRHTRLQHEFQRICRSKLIFMQYKILYTTVTLVQTRCCPQLNYTRLNRQLRLTKLTNYMVPHITNEIMKRTQNDDNERRMKNSVNE
jgi:hypothetical protein